jgi:hypothetical protein
VALHLPSLAGVFIYSSYGKCPFPCLQWGFPHTATITSFPTPRLLGGCRHSCLLWPAYSVTVPWGIPLPSSSALRVPCPLCYMSFFVIVVQFFFLFSLGGGRSLQRAMLIWPRVVCGSTTCRLAHLVVCISRAGRNWHLVAQEPSWFLRLPWNGDAMCGLEVWRNWRSQSFSSSQFFFQ